MLVRFIGRAVVCVGIAGAWFAANPGDATGARRAPKTWEVKMTNEGGNRFDPVALTIQDGDTVKWVIAGGSHNIAFWADSIPSGALELLRKAMSDTAAPLQSKRFPNPGDSYAVVFSGMPKGTYNYYCRPHLMRGMIASIKIE
jgi:plastocyanin